jgi:putative transposase
MPATKSAYALTSISGAPCAAPVGMSNPRRVLPGMTVMVTRRALLRTKLLRPQRELNELYLYCLALMSQRFSIAVHCFTVMSTHHHLVVTDTRGELPNFLRDLHRTLARCVKALHDWEDNVWDNDKPSVVELRTEQAVVEKVAYCMANPVAAGGVRRARQWPGLNVVPQQLGRMSWTVRRPAFYMDADNPEWPAVATLHLTMPPLTMSDALVRDAVSHELAGLEIEAHEAMMAKGWRFQGPQLVLAQSPFERATSPEPIRDRNPTFAVGRDQQEAFVDAVVVLREFRKAYRKALLAWRDGVRQVLFPAGTWLMSWAHSAMVAPS